MTVFVDTNVLIANLDTSEPQHRMVRELLASHGGNFLVTTDHVLLEVWWHALGHAGYRIAERFMAAFRGSGIKLEMVTSADFERALAIGERWADQEFDLVDRTSFAVMERLGCSRVLTFDKDFAVYRYGPDRTRHFDVLN